MEKKVSSDPFVFFLLRLSLSLSSTGIPANMRPACLVRLRRLGDTSATITVTINHSPLAHTTVALHHASKISWLKSLQKHYPVNSGYVQCHYFISSWILFYTFRTKKRQIKFLTHQAKTIFGRRPIFLSDLPCLVNNSVSQC